VSEAHVPTLAFSTLACPEWDAATVVQRAVRAGYGGIEWRGGPDGTVRSDWSKTARSQLRRQLADAGIQSVAVTAYTNFVSRDPGVVQQSIDDCLRHVELAADLGAPTVRVFLGTSDDAAAVPAATAGATDALRRLLERLAPNGVGVAIEPHDDHLRASSIAPILEALPDPRLGVVWDLGNAWSAGESPREGLAVYEGRIRYVQVKDGTGRGGSWRLCPLGEGDVPIGDALERLAALTVVRGESWPPVSLEWERAWHEDLAPADAVLEPARRWLAERVAAAIDPVSARS
jgi:sugar phosphate isomerase/epimerase